MNSAPQSSDTDRSDQVIREKIDEALATYLGRINHAELRSAAEYAVLGGGKRVRPLIAYRACEIAGAQGTEAMPAACAFELIHAFSLIHDDLPSLDDDDLRRGKPTVHRKFGECTAVLTGDLLQSMAMVIAAESTHHADRIAREVGHATIAMIEGQSWDTMGCFPANLDEPGCLELIHSHKTAALIRGAARCGVLAADGPTRLVEALGDWGSAVGLMFQVVDDLLDVTQSTEHLGKTAGKDRDQGKRTYPGIHGLEGTKAAILSLENAAETALAGCGAEADPLRELTATLARRTR
ncbi:MAG: polyprenyl synthetase family protein [Planctomycetota bacterium]|nr:polyprenyl synthetase family protein [Planctomycetota bacterium]